MADLMPVSNEIVEVLGINSNGLLDVKLLSTGSYAISTESSTDCSVTIHEFSFISQAGCAETTNSDEQIFTDFPWLLDIVAVNNCTGTEVLVYEAGAFNFVYVSTASGNSLYFEDGSFYCLDAANFDCRAAYNLDTPVAVWTCLTNVTPANGTDRTKHIVIDSDLKVFPNPTMGPIAIQVPGIENQIQELALFDVYGRLIERVVIPATKEITTNSIDLDDKENGIYYLILNSMGSQKVQKLVKQDLR